MDIFLSTGYKVKLDESEGLKNLFNAIIGEILSEKRGPLDSFKHLWVRCINELFYVAGQLRDSSNLTLEFLVREFSIQREMLMEEFEKSMEEGKGENKMTDEKIERSFENYSVGRDCCCLSNEVIVDYFGGVCSNARNYNELEEMKCPDKNGECPFNQIGPEATYRFENCRLQYDILMTLLNKGAGMLSQDYNY